MVPPDPNAATARAWCPDGRFAGAPPRLGPGTLRVLSAVRPAAAHPIGSAGAPCTERTTSSWVSTRTTARTAHRYGCALYDALYLALAQQLGLPFVTADAKLYRLIRARPEVVWIGDYPPAHPP